MNKKFLLLAGVLSIAAPTHTYNSQMEDKQIFEILPKKNVFPQIPYEPFKVVKSELLVFGSYISFETSLNKYVLVSDLLSKYITKTEVEYEQSKKDNENVDHNSLESSLSKEDLEKAIIVNANPENKIFKGAVSIKQLGKKPNNSIIDYSRSIFRRMRDPFIIEQGYIGEEYNFAAVCKPQVYHYEDGKSICNSYQTSHYDIYVF